ncbi:MAG: hypothetical protein MZV65_31935 [Chromatiales bacterium]|nr:hypothetical protein [Chromatiales bacterium]
MLVTAKGLARLAGRLAPVGMAPGQWLAAMRDYGRIHSKFWEQPEIAELTLEARLLAVYLADDASNSNMVRLLPAVDRVRHG